MAIQVKWIAAVNIVLVLVWLVVVYKIGREYDRRSKVTAEAVAAGSPVA
jgi:hypothetical protein